MPGVRTEEQAALIAEIVRGALGERPVAVEHVPTLEESTVYRVRLPSSLVYFKTEHEGHSISVAAWAYEKAARVGVPVPEVLHLDLTRERWPEEFVLLSAVEGTDLEHDPPDDSELVEILHRCGALLRRLHTVELEGFGELELGDGPEPRGASPDHASHVRKSPDWGFAYLVERGLVSDETEARVRDVLARHEELVRPPDRGILIHGDLGLDHVFVERKGMRITGIIDFEPDSADPVWDLAIFGFHFPTLLAHLLEGYGPVPDDLDVRLELYGLLRAIGCARWEDERGIDVVGRLREIDRLRSAMERRLG